jgi:hypothetical protein
MLNAERQADSCLYQERSLFLLLLSNALYHASEMLLEGAVTIEWITFKRLSQHTKGPHKNEISFQPGQKDAKQNDRNEDA